MLLRATTLAVIIGAIGAAGCNKVDNSVDLGPAPGTTGSAAAPVSNKPAGKGFSADLEADIAAPAKPAAGGDPTPAAPTPAVPTPAAPTPPAPAPDAKPGPAVASNDGKPAP
ncbi:MAG TPA: hypothetical protein VFP84_04545, partial [Kofleriaceae bacterium]|nr:hypothetical protein [Kofleriaceae bacterium]